MRGFEFAELKAFAAVVERKSFARAAENLGLSPSALSQTIRQLEARIGTRLLNRTTRSVSPSASGELLYGRIAPLFREMDAAVAEATEAAGTPQARFASTRWGSQREPSFRPGFHASTRPILKCCSTSWSTTLWQISLWAASTRASAWVDDLRRT